MTLSCTTAHRHTGSLRKLVVSLYQWRVKGTELWSPFRVKITSSSVCLSCGWIIVFELFLKGMVHYRIIFYCTLCTILITLHLSTKMRRYTLKLAKTEWIGNAEGRRGRSGVERKRHTIQRGRIEGKWLGRRGGGESRCREIRITSLMCTALLQYVSSAASWVLDSVLGA